MAVADVVVEVATLKHVHLVASRMRRADRAEILASGGFRPAQALRRMLRDSEFVRTAFIAGEAAAMFGVQSVEYIGIPWLLTTETVDRYPLSFWRASKALLSEIRQHYPLMQQAIDARYTQALLWAARLGFEIREAVPFGKAGLPFHPILLRS